MFRSATAIIAALTALGWLVAAILGLNDYAAAAMGFIPARLGGAIASWPAIPAVLTPLTATLVHANLLHLATNLLIFVWCGHEVERARSGGEACSCSMSLGPMPPLARNG